MKQTASPQGPDTTETFDVAAVETWIFDLDNTLYPAGSNLFDQIDRRIGEFSCNFFVCI